jgi:hypothetical protein
MIRFGTYTIYKNYDLRLIEQNDCYRLIYEGTNCPFNDFSVYTENVYYKDLLKEEISNAFFIKTLGVFKGYQFDISQLNQKNLIGIITDNKQAFEDLNLDFRERGVYQKEILICELDLLKEEYSPSSLDLPIPEGLPKERIIEIPNENL